MSARLTGAALAAVLEKAAEAAISGAVEERAARLQQALEDIDASRYAPSPALWGRVGEGADAAGGGLSSPLPEGEVGPKGRERVYGLAGEAPSGVLAGEFPNPSPAALRASTSPSGRGERKRATTTLTLSAPGLFAREFGALGASADPILGPAIEAVKRRPA